MPLIRDHIATIFKKCVPDGVSIEISIPERPEFGHYATALALRLAKQEGKNPREVAETLRQSLLARAPKNFFSRIEIAGPGFLNFWIHPEAIQKAFKATLAKRAQFGKGSRGEKRPVIVEYSQPNIAKKMHVGHLRTTVLGDALARVYAFLGHRVIRWNYYGDWGTQFGKLIAAYKLWGNVKAVRVNPIEELLALYVRFHDEAKKNPELDERGREEFQKLESGDRENRKLWQWFKKESLVEFKKIYRLLGVDFDVELGESAFEKDLAPLIAELERKGIARKSEGTLLIPLDEASLPPALLRKSDGASLYLTRDIASLRYRIKKYRPEKILYVVGNEQSLHFAQLFAVAGIIGLSKKTELMHVKYGLVLAEGGKKFATREGRAVFLDEVIREAVVRAREIVEEKNHSLSSREKNKVAEMVAVGALKYANLKEYRTSDIVFDWERMLDFSGDSAPYLQYTHARLSGILRKVKLRGRADVRHLKEERDLLLVLKLFEFPRVVEESAAHYTANPLATYLYGLAVQLNQFYEMTPIMKDEDVARRNARLALLSFARDVLARGLSLLGITAPLRM